MPRKEITEAKDLLGNQIEYITVYAVARTAAKRLHPKKVPKLLHDHAKKAVERLSEMRPLKMEKPYNIEFVLRRDFVAFADTIATLRPSLKKVGEKQFTFTANRMEDFLSLTNDIEAIVLR